VHAERKIGRARSDIAVFFYKARGWFSSKSMLLLHKGESVLLKTCAKL
jgi:hypothetical protein